MRRANRACMSARVIGFSFVALAGACDLAGAHSAAFYLLLVAVCGIAVAALGAATLAGSLAVFAVLGAVSWRSRSAARTSSAHSWS